MFKKKRDFTFSFSYSQNPDEDFSVDSKMIGHDEVIITCKVLHSVNQVSILFGLLYFQKHFVKSFIQSPSSL